MGKWTITSAKGEGNRIEIARQLGLLYSAFYYTGFKVNSGEYKLMGLAPYGAPESEQTREFYDKILGEVIDLRADGSLLLNMKYFDFATGLTMCKDKLFQRLFGLPKRQPESGHGRGRCIELCGQC